MNPEIPGYYYDAVKKRYFKIEKSQTALPSASWSSDAVKRRKINDDARRVERQRERLVRNHIKRNVLGRDTLTHGLLAREIGLDYTAEHGRGRLLDGELSAEVWARGLVRKGRIPFVPSFARDRFANIPCFYIGVEDNQDGMGVAYASLDEETLIGSYISTDDNGYIKLSRGSNTPGPDGIGSIFRTEMIRCPQMSSIKYHRPSHRILLTSREPDHSCGLFFFSPPLSGPEGDGHHWLLGETNHYQRLSIRHSMRREWLVNGCTPAPASSNLICVMGTNCGVLRVLSNESMSWIAPTSPRKGVQTPQEIFAQDFQIDNSNILFAGGRQSRLWTTDLRTPESEWTFTSHASSISHLRSINSHQVLVAGLRNSMALYDTRFFGRRPNGPKPLLTFPDYRNEAHLQVGWDVNPQLNVVAAAQDNGTVKIFSLASGRRLRNPVVDAIRTQTPVKALMFQQMPRDQMSSLFVGEGPSIRKLSFGPRELEDEV